MFNSNALQFWTQTNGAVVISSLSQPKALQTQDNPVTHPLFKCRTNVCKFFFQRIADFSDFEEGNA